MDRPPSYQVRRLLQAAAVNWPNIDGEHASRGVAPGDLSPDRFCNLIEWWLHLNMAPEQWVTFKATLDEEDPILLPSGVPVPVMSEAEEGEAFMAFMQQVTGEKVSHA